MSGGLGRISRTAATQAVTPREKHIPKTKRGLAVKYTGYRVDEEIKMLKSKLEKNKGEAFFDQDRSLSQRLKLILVDALDVLKAAIRITVIGLRYISGALVPRFVFGDAELSQPPAFDV